MIGQAGLAATASASAPDRSCAKSCARALAESACRAQGFEQRMSRIAWLRGSWCTRASRCAFFRQAEGNRGVPADIGAPVHVIADPAGETVRAAGRKDSHSPGQRLRLPSSRRATMVSRASCARAMARHRLGVFVGQRHWPAFGRRGAEGLSVPRPLRQRRLGPTGCRLSGREQERWGGR